MAQPDYTNMRKIVTGDVIVKCRYGDDIRRIVINQAPSFDELYLMMTRVFKLPNTEDITLKYTDNENDLISLLDDNDITHAISQSHLLKVTVLDKKNEGLNNLQVGSVITEDLKNQLTSLRDALDAILRFVPEKKEEKPVQVQQSVDSKYRQLSSAELDDTTKPKIDSTPKESTESVNSTNANINKQSTPTIKNNNSTFLPPGTPKQTPMKSPAQTSPYAQRPPLNYPNYSGTPPPHQHSPSAPGTPHNVYQTIPNNNNKFNGPPPSGPNFMNARPPVPPMQQNQRPPPTPNGFAVPSTPSLNQQQLPPQQQQFRPHPPQQQGLPPQQQQQGPPSQQQQGPPPSQQGQQPLIQQQSAPQGPLPPQFNPQQQQQQPYNYYSMPGTNNQAPPQTPQQNFRPPPSGNF